MLWVYDSSSSVRVESSCEISGMAVMRVHRQPLPVPAASCSSTTCLAGKIEGHLGGGKWESDKV
jgi:hypothetical protein